MKTIFVVGTAGSGKSTFTYAFSEWLKDNEQSVMTVNLDPAAIATPYEPDVDVREVVDYDRIMASRGLGPNAALIASVREVAKNIEVIAEPLSEASVDYIIVDTPGQLELFAFRKEGRMITRSIAKGLQLMTYLLDPILVTSVRNFAASLFLATSIYITFSMPFIFAVTKVDVVPKKYLRRLTRWMSSQESLEVDIENRARGVQMLITREVARVIYDIGQSFPMVMVSSKTLEGMSNLHAAITRVLGEGEDELR